MLALTEEAVTRMDDAREGSHGPGIGTLRATEQTRTVGERDRFWGVIRAPRRGNAPPHVARTLHGQFETRKASSQHIPSVTDCTGVPRFVIGVERRSDLT